MAGKRPVRALAVAVALGAALCAGHEPAQAQSDYATCSADLVACDGDHDNCCHRPFDPVGSKGAIVIPLDRCHQVIASSGKLAPPDSASPQWCVDEGPFSANDTGMYRAYGLAYRLMQAGIPVYWAVNPTKDPPALTNSQNAGSQTYINTDIDLWVVNATASPPAVGSALSACTGTCADPVARLSATTLAPVASSYNATAFPVRGSAFLIAAEDRTRFDAFWLKTGEFAGHAANSYYDFSEVDLYELQPGAKIVYQDYRTASPYTNLTGAPIAVRIDYKPPRLARLSPAGVSEIWLAMANLKQAAAYPACLTGTFSPSDAVYCDVKESDIRSGYLVDGEFQWAWIDNWSDNSPCETAAETTQVEKVEDFMTAVPGVRAGGHVMFMEAVIGVVEGCKGHEPMGKKDVGLATLNITPTEPLILRRPHNLYMQWGDVPTEFSQGAVTRFQYWGNGGQGYEPSHTASSGSLVRLASEDATSTSSTQCVLHKSSSSCDVFANSSTADNVDVVAYLRYKDNPENGIVFYTAGNQVNNAPSHLRMILNALIATPFATVPQEHNEVIKEISRSSPIVATVGGVEAQYQGSYEVVDPPRPVPTYLGAVSADTFTFPYTRGHLRAIETSNIGATATELTALGDGLFDADDGIPTPRSSGCGGWFSASCRTVFTNTVSGSRPSRVYLTTGNVASLKPLMAPTMTTEEVQTLIGRVLAGSHENGSWVPRLGGVDRSTLALIESSPLAGVPRPTIAYFGALDGMLHAVCAEVAGPCTRRGQELWAFIPRTQLPNLRRNTARIDGSPKVADVFGDFTGSGVRAWRTILSFQLGSGEPGFADRTPSVFALDVTDPGDPRILWETTTAADRGAVELGVGLNLAMGPVTIGGAQHNLVFVETNNGGTGGPGIYLAALDAETGDAVWTWKHVYPGARSADDPPVPATGIPGGVAAIDRDGKGTLTHLAVPSLYGDLWLIEADDGGSAYGSRPLFRFTSDFHPIGASPTIYRDISTGTLHAVVVSGGYADPVNSSWAPAAVHQYAVAVSLETPLTVAPLIESGSDLGGNRPFVIDLGAGNRAYAQATASGNELFIATDSGDVNDQMYGLSGATGRLGRYSLTAGVVLGGGAHSLPGGASSVDVRRGAVHSGSGSAVVKTDVSAGFDSSGTTTELVFTAATGRRLWLRLR